MAVNLKVDWRVPIDLVDGSSVGLIYDCDRKKLPTNPGVYVFVRCFGSSVIPIYIGETGNMESRIDQHLNSVPLMVGIKQQPQGTRVLLVGVFQSKKGQQQDKCLLILERALIRHALAEGHVLLNKQGVKTPVHQIDFSGTKKSHEPFPRHMSILAS